MCCEKQKVNLPRIMSMKEAKERFICLSAAKFKNLSQMVIVQVKPRYSISHWWFGGTLLWPVTCWEIGVLSLVCSTVFWWNTGARGKQGKYPGVTEVIGNETEAMQWCNGDNGDNYLLENIFIIITPPL